MATWTEEDVQTLKAAVASGVLSVTYDGPPRRSITYHSLTEMRSLLAEMTSTVAAAASPRTSTSRRAVVRSGFRSGGRSCFRRNE